MSNKENDGEDGSDEEGKQSVKDAVSDALMEALIENLKDTAFGGVAKEVEKMNERIDSAASKLRTLGMLFGAVLFFALITTVVWLFVGIVYLANNASIFGGRGAAIVGGAIIGYLLCLATGLIYMRG